MDISVIIPAYNEESNVLPLYSKLKKVLTDKSINKYEIIFIDDCSTDSTRARLLSLKDKRLRVISLRKRSGQTAAQRNGFKTAKYGTIITLDCDLQNDPADIPSMLEKFREGYDCVCGWRYSRRDPLSRIVSSRIANSVRRFVLKDNFHDISCSLRVFKKECLDGIELFDGAHRFLPFLIRLKGYNVIEHKVRHHPRLFGKTKYGIMNRVFKATADMFRVKKLASELRNERPSVAEKSRL